LATIEAVKQAVHGSLTQAVKKVQLDMDRYLVLLLTVSIFLPFYFSVACVISISIMTMINCRKRDRAFSAPYTKFLFVFVIATFFIAAYYNNYVGMMYSITIYAVVVSALYLRSVMTRLIFNQALDLACLASIWCLFIALYQKATAYALAPNYRPVSVFSNANYYGMVLEFVILIALYRIFTNPKLTAFYLMIISLNFFGIYLTASFSSLAAVLCAVIAMLLLKRQYRYVVAFVLAAALLAGIFVLFPALVPRGSEALDRTIAERLSIWATAVRGFRQEPLFGQGAMTYQLIYEQFAGYKTYHCHNLFLDMLLNYGIVGFAAVGFYFFMQARILLFRFRSNICNNMNILLLSMLTAILVHGMTDVTIFWIQTAALFLLVYSSTGIDSVFMERRLLPEFLSEYSSEPYLRRPT
jgi:O-antigen ligase